MSETRSKTVTFPKVKFVFWVELQKQHFDLGKRKCVGTRFRHLKKSNIPKGILDFRDVQKSIQKALEILKFLVHLQGKRSKSMGDVQNPLLRLIKSQPPFNFPQPPFNPVTASI